MVKEELKISNEEIEALLIPERKDITEVSDLIKLPTKSNMYDSIHLELTPYLYEPLSKIDAPEVDWIFVIAPTQSGKTLFLQHVVADTIYQNAGTLIYALPDRVSARKNAQEKIIDVINASPELAKFKTNTKTDVSREKIALQNMTVYVSWAGSLASLSSTSARVVIMDEIRLAPKEIGVESNAIKLLNDRLTVLSGIGDSQGYGVSSPSVKGDLLYRQTQKKESITFWWHVPCLSCGKYQVLHDQDNIKLYDGKPKCVCKFCKEEFTNDNLKKEWNNKGVYAIKDVEKVYNDGSVELSKKRRGKRIPIYRWNSMVSPFRSFKKIWYEFINTKDDIGDYKNFVQCWRAEFWEERESVLTESKLRKRKTNINQGVVPEGTKLITAGIDTQDDGFYVVVRAWMEKKQTHVISAFKIHSDKDTDTIEEVKEKLYGLFELVYTTINGKKWKVACVAIDTGGHRTKELYAATEKFENFFWIKGRDNQNAKIKFSKVDSLYLVRTGDYLDETDSKIIKNTSTLYNSIDNDFINQYTNIVKKLKTKKDTNESSVFWVKKGQYDYRMADIHNFICLDIPLDNKIIRHQIEDPKFEWNPFHVSQLSMTDNLQDEVVDKSNDDWLREDFLSTEEDWL